MAIETALTVRIANTGAGQTVRDVAGVQKALQQLGKESKDTAATAAALGKAFDLPDDQVQALADAMGQAKAATEGAADAAGTYRDALGRLRDANGRFVKDGVDGFNQLGAAGKKEAGALDKVFTGFFEGIGRKGVDIAVDLFRQLGTAIAGTVAAASSEFKAFDAALTQFDAKSTASAEQIARIGDQAKELAAVTSQTPAGVAQLATALLTLGATAEDVETNLRGITLLADVLGEDPVLTGQVVQTGVNIFGEFGETADSLSDKLNFLVNNSAAGAQQGLSEFFQLFADVGGIVGATGASFDDLGAAFAVLRNGGASASIAATSIKTALLALSGPTTEAAKELERLGVSAFDNNGEFIGLGATLEQFQAALAGLSQQEQLDLATTVFGREGAPGFLAGVKEASGDIATLRGQLSTQADGSLAESLEVINQSLERQQLLLEGNVSGALTTLGAAIAPIELALTQFANALLVATTEGSAGLGGLTEAAERFRAVLVENPEIAQRLGQALATVADAGVAQIAQLIDAITAFLSEQGNIELMASTFEDLADIVTLLGQTARFVVALTETLIGLQDTVENIPVLGNVLDFNPANPISSVQQLIGTFTTLRNVVTNVAEFVAGLVGRFNELAQNPVLEALVNQILETEASTSGLGDSIGSSLSGAVESLGAAGEQVATNLQQVGDSAEIAAGRTTAAAETIEDALKRLGDTNKAALADLSTDAANARAALLEAGGDPAKLAENEAKALRDRIATNKAAFTELQALQSGSLGAEDAAAVADQIRSIEGQLASDRVSLAQQTLAEKQRTEKAATEAAEAAAKKQTDALKAQRDEEKRIAEERQADAERAAQREFDDARDGRSEARDTQRRAEDKALQDELQADDRAFQEQRRANDKAFQDQQQADAEAFQRSQQQAAEAFQKRLNAERDQGSREFDALDSEVDKRLQLAQADADTRKELKAQFEEERKTLELRRQIEKEVLAQRGSVLAGEDLSLSPLEQARADFEARLQEKAAAFQESQQLASQAFQEQQAAEAEARAEALRLEDQRRADERAAADEARAEQRRAEDKAFEEQERAIQDQFEAQQREAKAAFNAQQRAQDEASARQIAAILAAAKPAAGQSLRAGGVAEGGVVQVHRDEFLLPPKGTRVVSQRESRALVRQALSARDVGAMMQGLPIGRGLSVQAVGGTGKLESQMAELLKEVKRGRKVQAGPTSFTLNTPTPGADAVNIQMDLVRGLIRQGGL